LRRQTDVARGIIEKTRGDVTVSLRGEHLTQAIKKLSSQLNDGKDWIQPDGQSAESGVFLSRNDEDE
jgi:translin